jgi:thioredoxin 1
MKPTSLILIAVVVAAVVAVVALKPARNASASSTAGGTPTVAISSAAAPAAPTVGVVAAPVVLPRLLDLGAGKCIPCKLMAPILEDLKTTNAGVLRVDFIDVWEDKAAAQAHGISSIPTQIFFAPDGKELFRHEGFFSKEDMLAQWKTLGYDLKPAAQMPASTSATTETTCPTGTTCPTSVPAPAPAQAGATPAKRSCCGSTP